MRLSNVIGAAVSVALAAAFVLAPASTTSAKEDEILRLRAFAINMNNGARTGTIDIVIERWSTDEEASALKATLAESGEEKLLSSLQKLKPRCGFARTSESLGWDIHFAREIPLPDGGRKIVLATDRPVGMWEARASGRSMDYQFSLAEIRLPAAGKGQGKAIPRAALGFNAKTNTLEIENYEREPVRLNEITVIEPKPKK